MSIRSVVKQHRAKEASEGMGARVKRTVGTAPVGDIDPFLLLDHFFVKPPAGFPDHPHRGFETLTYMLDGKFTHKDNQGNEGTIRSGGVQWMTAGKGIIHSEMPGTDGVNSGLQLWLNLPSSEKMCEPRYQDLEPEDIPLVEDDGIVVRIIAGSYGDKSSTVDMKTPIRYYDVLIKEEGKVFENALEPEFSGFIYVIDGSISIGSDGVEKSVSNAEIAILSEGEQVRVVADRADSRFVIIAGTPLREPVCKHGPFVMNTREEIEQAFADYYAGKF